MNIIVENREFGNEGKHQTKAGYIIQLKRENKKTRYEEDFPRTLNNIQTRETLKLPVMQEN